MASSVGEERSIFVGGLSGLHLFLIMHTVWRVLWGTGSVEV